jgi:superfamily II DNA or RNA helicase
MWMPFNLHNYQRNLVNKARESYANGHRAPCIVAPCGAGKSVMISEIARMTTDKGNRVLFLVHRRELIDQIQNTFRLNEVNMNLVEFGMVQTVVRRLDTMPKPSLIITDENHHALAKSYRKIYDHFSDVLRLGFTATPIRLNGEGLGDVNDILIEEVDAEWLIANGFLSPYKYYAPKLINEDYLKLGSMKEFTNKSIDEALGKVIFGDVIKHYRTLADGEQAIAYCHSIEASLRIAEEFNAEGIPAAHIDAKTPKEQRAEIIAKFRSKEIRILSNVDLIGEGFDVPDCSTVIMLRPTKSLSLYIQQSMRGMRFKEGKTSIIIDHVGNAHRFGLPDEKRQWSLEGKKKSNSGPEIKIKECEICYAVYPSDEKECPMCGHVPEVVRVNKKEHDEDFELQEVTKDDFKVTLDFREPSDCKSMAELYELAKSRGYKRGWAYHQGKLLGFIG